MGKLNKKKICTNLKLGRRWGRGGQRKCSNLLAKMDCGSSVNRKGHSTFHSFYRIFTEFYASWKLLQTVNEGQYYVVAQGTAAELQMPACESQLSCPLTGWWWARSCWNSLGLIGFLIWKLEIVMGPSSLGQRMKCKVLRQHLARC